MSFRSLLLLAWLVAFLLGCGEPATPPPSATIASSAHTTVAPPSAPAPTDDDAIEPVPAASGDVAPRCAELRQALERFVEALPTACDTDADCMTSSVRMTCEPGVAHHRAAFTPARTAELQSLRHGIRLACPAPEVVCGPPRFDPAACEAGVCRPTRTASDAR